MTASRDIIMNQSANVRSLEGIKAFRIAYTNLAEDCKRALDSVRMDVRRFSDWLDNDQVNYWKSQIKNLQKKLAEAKAELNRKQLAGATSRGSKPDLTEAKMNVRKIMQQIEIANGKLQKIKKWKPVVERAIRTYEGQARQLANMLETEVPNSMSLLEGMITAIDAYAKMAPVSGSRASAGAKDSGANAEKSNAASQAKSE